MSHNSNDYFLCIAEQGSLSKAAEKLYLSQPSLSQYLKRLENRLGAELFDRTSSPLLLTAAGERYLQYARQERELKKRLEQDFLDLSCGKAGTVSLGIALWRGAGILPRILPPFFSAHPSIRVKLFEGTSDHLLSLLSEDSIDFAFLNLVPHMDLSDFVCETVLMEEILFAGPSDHPAVRNALNLASPAPKGSYPKISYSQLQGLPLLLTGPRQNLTRQVFFALKNHGIEPNLLLQTENLDTAIELSSAGLGFTFIPAGGLPFAGPKNLVLFTLDDPALLWPLSIVRSRMRPLSKTAGLLADTAKECLKGSAEKYRPLL